ncbi:secretion protein snm4 [Streptomyces sp. GS7]|uniref:secretion protein snm4 n=1 Tax=Streptomyces sp. GS7 TaxID=2692234 RepID=UPI0013168C01|nr:secretion protein snm4 [Streptomyces sp. GS7]QHC20405.1 secretion protein snm4 [Streptomyces sp. GS7]
MTSVNTGVGAGAGQRGSGRTVPATAPAGRDLTGDAADPLDVHGWGWGEPSRTWTAVTASVLLAAVAGVCAGAWYGDGAAARWLGGVAVVAAGAGAALAAPARTGRPAPGTALLLSGGTLGAVAAWQAAPAGAARLAAVGLTAAAVLALLGLRTGLGRGGLTGAAALALAVGAWEAGLALTGPTPTGAALGFLSVLALGALPRLALTAAGLTRLDDRHSGGTPVSRHQVAAALGATHRGLAPATVAMAASAGAAGVLVAGDGGIWSVLTAVLLSVVLFSRARAYPLAIEVVALLAAGAAVCVRLVLLCATAGGAPGLALAALCVLAAVPAAVLAVRVPEPLRARLWRWLDLVESVSMVALIPVGLGACGLYGLLWGGS